MKSYKETFENANPKTWSRVKLIIEEKILLDEIKKEEVIETEEESTKEN